MVLRFEDGREKKEKKPGAKRIGLLSLQSNSDILLLPRLLISGMLVVFFLFFFCCRWLVGVRWAGKLLLLVGVLLDPSGSEWAFNRALRGGKEQK